MFSGIPRVLLSAGGYTELSAAIRTNVEATEGVLVRTPELALEITTGGATPLHVCGMSSAGEHSTALVLDACRWLGRASAEDIDVRDTWGYTALQRHATNNLAVGAAALLAAGASHTCASGLEGTGDSARALALRLRSYAVLRVFQQHELAQGLPLPDGEIEL